MLSNVLAEVWISPGYSMALRTVPGRVLKFVGGHATVYQHDDMPHVLRMPNAKIEITREWKEWLPSWLAKCQPPFAPAVQATYWVEGDLDGCDGVVAAPVQTSEHFPPDIAQASPGRHPAGHQCQMCHNYRVGLMKKRAAGVAVG